MRRRRFPLAIFMLLGAEAIYFIVLAQDGFDWWEWPLWGLWLVSALHLLLTVRGMTR